MLIAIAVVVADVFVIVVVDDVDADVFLLVVPWCSCCCSSWSRKLYCMQVNLTTILHEFLQEISELLVQSAVFETSSLSSI